MIRIKRICGIFERFFCISSCIFKNSKFLKEFFFLKYFFFVIYRMSFMGVDFFNILKDENLISFSDNLCFLLLRFFVFIFKKYYVVFGLK